MYIIINLLIYLFIYGCHIADAIKVLYDQRLCRCWLSLPLQQQLVINTIQYNKVTMLLIETYIMRLLMWEQMLLHFVMNSFWTIAT